MKHMQPGPWIRTWETLTWVMGRFLPWLCRHDPIFGTHLLKSEDMHTYPWKFVREKYIGLVKQIKVNLGYSFRISVKRFNLQYKISSQSRTFCPVILTVYRESIISFPLSNSITKSNSSLSECLIIQNYNIQAILVSLLNLVPLSPCF